MVNYIPKDVTVSLEKLENELEIIRKVKELLLKITFMI